MNTTERAHIRRELNRLDSWEARVLRCFHSESTTQEQLEACKREIGHIADTRLVLQAAMRSATGPLGE